MNGSDFSLLQNVDLIVLAAGHGGTDPGAVSAGYKERDQVIEIVDEMAKLLRSWGVGVEVAPHDHDTHQTIPYLNDRYGFGDAWVVEVHRDSATGLSPDDASLRCGCYYGTSSGSRLIGRFIRDAMKEHGAHSNTWARPDTASNHGSLGWIRQTRQLAHLLELGFMQGSNTQSHLMFLAEIGAKALFEAFTGRNARDADIRDVVDPRLMSRSVFDAVPNGTGDIMRLGVSAARDEYVPLNTEFAMARSPHQRADEAVLHILGAQSGVLPAVEEMIAMRNTQYPNSRPRYWGVVNFSRHSSKKRLYIFDVAKETVSSYRCAHGIGSEGPTDDGMANIFSNVPGSHCTSLGIYRCAETYTGSNGYSMRLDGLESTNSNARSRYIVMHGAHYVSKAYANKHGRIGRSEGCPALDHKFTKRVIDELKHGSFLNHWIE